MAIRLTGYFREMNNPEYRIDIYDADFVGTATEFDVKHLRIRYDSDKNNDPNATVMGSRADIGINVNYLDTIIPEFIEDFAQGQENRFFVEVTKVLSSLVIWRGILTPDFAGEEDTAPVYVYNASAVCGLATLKKVPYHDGEASPAIYEGIERITTHLATALGKMAHVSEFWTGSDIFFKTAIDWWEASMDSGAADDSLFQAAVDHSAFYDFKTSGDVDKDVISCYDVISHILRAFNARIAQIEGVWWIEQIPYRTASPYYTRHYDLDGAYLSNQVNSGANVIDQTRTGAKLATMNYDFLPALKRVDVTYKVKMRRNLIAGTTDTQPNFNQDISANGGTAIMRLKFTLNYHIVDNGLGAPAGAVYFAIPRVVLKIGSYYLNRPYTIQNYTAIVQAPAWTTAIGGAIYVPIQIGQIVAGTDGVSGSIQVELLTPPLPAGGSSNLFDMDEDECEIKKFNGTLMADNLFIKSLHIVDQYLEVFDQGTPFVTEDQTLYTATNDNGASEREEKVLIIGTAGFANSVGRLKILDGAEWVNAGSWGQGTGARIFAIGALLALNLANQRDIPIRRLNGSMLGDFRMHRLIQTSDGKKWMMMNCVWDVPGNTIQGTWFELRYGDGGVASTPVKIKLLPPGGFPTIDPSGPGLGISNQAPGFYNNPPPTVLKPVSYNAIEAKIDVGDTVTSIALNVASLGNEFLSGDSVTIVHPVTGVYQDFEIDTPPGLGDTSLSVVSEAAAYDFPEGSYLVIKQKPYSFALPEGTHPGQILRWNHTSGAWEIYSGTVDGNVLEWDSTHGWQEGTPGGGGGGITDLTGDVTATGPGSVAATIANNAVTLAKMQQITTDRLLGRDTAGTGIVELIALNVTLEFDGSGNLRRAALTGDVTAAAGGNATTIANNAVTTVKIADDAVTYAKLQNIVNNNRVLGRVSGANGIVEELTQAQLYTLLGITGVANRFAIFTGANALTTAAAFTHNGVDRMTITGTVAGFGAGNALLNISTGALTSTEFLRLAGTITGNLSATIFNARNVAATDNAILNISSGGAAAGDAIIQFSINGVITHAIGADNTDDRLKLTPDSATPGGAANRGLILRNNAGTGNTGVNKDFPTFPLDGLGYAKFNLWGGTGNEFNPAFIAFGAGAGTAPSLSTIVGMGNAVRIAFQTGTTPTNNGDILIVSYPFVFPTTSIVTFSSRSGEVSDHIEKFYISAEDAAGFTLKARGTLPANEDFTINFHFWGY